MIEVHETLVRGEQMPRQNTSQLDMENLCSMGISVTQMVVRNIMEQVAEDAETALEAVYVGKHKKKALCVDVSAEFDARRTFRRQMGRMQRGDFKKIEFFGEESLRDVSLDLSDSKKVCILADAVDGTDLLERGLWNWCSAFVFFHPSKTPGERILAAFVGLPTGEVYHARCDNEHAWVTRGSASSTKPVRVEGPSDVKAVHQASVCFYGQKAGNMRTTLETGVLGGLEQSISDKKIKADEVTLRLYDLAGIPMMMKLIDHRAKTACGIDVVFDVAGQKPHDVIPGAFIAKKAGVAFKNLKGEDISDTDLETLLLKPAAVENELKYVLAATEELANSMIKLLSVKTH
ncbi:MAG: hypothetical protein ACK4UN_08730 [Limisphaerales bacterium]